MSDANDRDPNDGAADAHEPVSDEELIIDVEPQAAAPQAASAGATTLQPATVDEPVVAPAPLPTYDESTHLLVKRKVLRHFPGIILVVSALILVAGGAVGYFVGKQSRDIDSSGLIMTVAADAHSPQAIAKRNVVWRVLNGEGDALPDSPEKQIGAALANILGPETDQEMRSIAIGMLLEKSKAYFNDDVRKEMTDKLIEGSPEEGAAVFATIVMADGQGSDLLRGVLSDAQRVGALLAGKKVPLEKLPNGTTP